MKAAIYCRLSSEDRDKRPDGDSESIQNQRSMLLRFAAERGWEIYDIYSDDDCAGTDRKRPEFNRLLNDAEAKRFDVILCKTQSRFTREIELVEKYINTLFPIWGIRFMSVVDNADTAVKSNARSRQINGLINEWYLQDLSENVRSVLANKRRQGLFTGSQPLYGYVKDPDRKGRLLIDEEAAEVVREIFMLYAGGMSSTEIARELDRRGIPNPTEYKRRRGIYNGHASKYGSLWSAGTISDMLKNEMYIGNMVQGRYGSVSYKTRQNRPKPRSEWVIVKGTHEPVVGAELWNRVQALMGRKTAQRSPKRVGIFAGKARCAFCGSALRSSKPSARTHGADKRYLVCPKHYADAGSCPGACVAEDRLEGYLLAELKRLTEAHLDFAKLETRLDALCGGGAGKAEAEIAAYENAASDCVKGIKELYLDKVKGVVTEETFIELSKELERERNRLSALIEAETARLAELRENADRISRRVERILLCDRLTGHAVNALVDSIAVGRRIPGTHEVPVEILWRF
ncbi:MAG: recombinase family protein [Clostridia bacterium]|nr:recombinase family protein [Clostridia bacterium]